MPLAGQEPVHDLDEPLRIVAVSEQAYARPISSRSVPP
jgi:hypothetical protein